jgi:hypothetical protein
MSKKVRIRNIDYALTGSVDIKGSSPIKYRLEPNKWTEVPDEVYDQLKNKFGNAKFSEVPNSLPGADGNYYGYPGQVRAEQTNGQYLIEFAQ